MYTFIKRTAPPPSMLTFDASNRDQCEVRRVVTNTPLQALVLLNDPQVVEAARVLAQNMMQEPSDINSKIEKAFRIIVCRIPTDAEKTILNTYFEKEKNNFTQAPFKANSMLQAGEFKLASNKSNPDTIETAALMLSLIHIYS